jgi:hypothetical protein
MKIIGFSGTTFPTVLTFTRKSLFCSVVMSCSIIEIRMVLVEEIVAYN